MKKKIIASLLTASMVVGFAIPALAISSQSGLDEEITGLAFDSGSYTVKQGETLDLSKKVMAFAGNSKLVQEPILEWSLQNDSNFAFGLEEATGMVDAIESKGTATVTVTANQGKVKASVKVNAAAAAKEVMATGFTFEKSAYTLLTGSDATVGFGDQIVVVPTPNGATFTAAQEAAIKANVANLEFAGVTPVVGNKDKNITFTYDNAALKAVTTTGKSVTVQLGEVEFPIDGKNPIKINRSVRIDSKLALKSNAIYSTGNKTIQVGEKINISDLFKQGPSAHSITLDVSYGLDFVDQNATVLDYADIIVENKTRNTDSVTYVQGVAVGQNKITATLANGKTASAIVTVVARNTKAPTLSATTVSAKVNEPIKISVNNIPAGKEVTWKVSDSKIAQLNVFKGASTTAYPKKDGKVTVTAMIDGQVIGTTTITVGATSSNKPNKPGSTNNPQTSDKVLANLFA